MRKSIFLLIHFSFLIVLMIDTYAKGIVQSDCQTHKEVKHLNFRFDDNRKSMSIQLKVDSLSFRHKEPGDFHFVTISQPKGLELSIEKADGWIKYSELNLVRLNKSVYTSGFGDHDFYRGIKLSKTKNALVFLASQLPGSEEDFTIITTDSKGIPHIAFDGEYYIADIKDVNADGLKELVCIEVEKNEDRHFSQFIILELYEGTFTANKKLTYNYNKAKRSYRKYPQSSLRYLKLNELKEFTLEDLSLMRNEIFADHGYIFKNKTLKNYFDTKKWYQARYDDVTVCSYFLTDIEKHNIRLIKTRENDIRLSTKKQ